MISPQYKTGHCFFPEIEHLPKKFDFSISISEMSRRYNEHLFSRKLNTCHKYNFSFSWKYNTPQKTN